jgi:hypothetical protein
MLTNLYIITIFVLNIFLIVKKKLLEAYHSRKKVSFKINGILMYKTEYL